MTTTLAQATAAPTELKINGQTYLLRPLRDKDFGELESWLRSRAMLVAREHLDGFTGEDRKILLEAAYKKASKISITSPDAVELLMSRDGAARLIWLGLRIDQPAMTIEEVSAWFTDAKLMNQVMAQFDEINELSSVPDRKKKSRKRKSASPSTARRSTVT